ncbi:hypothetical protein [Actimicrobium antarcticum]|uniref:EF-hand domain-containing protein n=1 Tax=Actimicrobium antarcticum TaxID=1051899 RepID=A0ABP7TIM9_9BURK
MNHLPDNPGQNQENKPDDEVNNRASTSTAVKADKSSSRIKGFLSGFGSAAQLSAQKALSNIQEVTTSAADHALSTGRSVGNTIGEVMLSTGQMIKAGGVIIGDLNGDGKVDEEDFKIAAAKIKDIASATATEVGILGKEALHSDIVKDAAAGAIVGGAIASVIPFVGTITGATVGAVAGVVKSIRK